MRISNALTIGAEMLPWSPDPAVDARILLQHAISAEHSYLLAHADSLLTPQQVDHYFALIARAARDEPIPYIVGTVGFRFIDVAVTADVLIPRPETEELVDKVLAWTKGRSHLRVVDVGTGSGCIAISLAREMAAAQVTAIEISAEALQVAQQNAASNQVQIDFRQGSLLEPLREPVDLIVANLPYIAETERDLLAVSVAQFEPALALFGGEDGLDLVAALLQQARGWIRPKGAIFLEIGFQQAAAAYKLAQRYFPQAAITCHTDYAGQDRFIVIERN